jgi:hypothetical protein
MCVMILDLDVCAAVIVAPLLFYYLGVELFDY